MRISTAVPVFIFLVFLHLIHLLIHVLHVLHVLLLLILLPFPPWRTKDLNPQTTSQNKDTERNTVCPDT